MADELIKRELKCYLTETETVEIAKQAAVIVNEEGQAVFDDAFIQAHNLSVKYVRGG